MKYFFIFVLSCVTYVSSALSGYLNPVYSIYYQMFQSDKLVGFYVKPGFYKVEEAPKSQDTNISQPPTHKDANASSLVFREPPKLTIGYRYIHNIDTFSMDDVKSVFKEIETAWSPCGVRLVNLESKSFEEKTNNTHYSGKSIYSGGESQSEEQQISENKLLYWVRDSQIYGEARPISYTQGDGKPIVTDFTMKLSSTITSRNELKATLIHEFGHIIGLDHSSDKTSVMYYASNGKYTKQNIMPNTDDVKECHNVLQQIDLPQSNNWLSK